MSYTQEQFALLEQWRIAQAEAKQAKLIVEREQELRRQVAATFFPSPKEGTNRVALPERWELKYTHKIDRKIEAPVLPSVIQRFQEMGFSLDKVVEYEPTLKVKAYKELSDDRRKIFDECLIIKPGSPTLELLEPKPEA